MTYDSYAPCTSAIRVRSMLHVIVEEIDLISGVLNKQKRTFRMGYFKENVSHNMIQTYKAASCLRLYDPALSAVRDRFLPQQSYLGSARG